MSQDTGQCGAETVRVEKLDEGSLWRVTLDAPKGNVLDAAMVESLTGVFEDAAAETELRAVVIEGAGRHFSFGASVPEHLPGEVGAMLPRFHGLFRAMRNASVFTAAAVRGHCLGGGLEVAAFCERVFASRDAYLGQPEIVLGVFAPVGSIVLPGRIGRAQAADLCLSGRIVGVEEAVRMGLVDVLADDPAEAAVKWVHENLMQHSAASLRFAVKALHVGDARFFDDLEQAERLYLDELMATPDAVEGLNAFLEKRAPKWRSA